MDNNNNDLSSRIVGSPKGRGGGRRAHHQKHHHRSGGSSGSAKPGDNDDDDDERKKATALLPTLVQLCRQTIVFNLERYPPEAFGIVDPDEWDELVRLRHESTRPKQIMVRSGNTTTTIAAATQQQQSQSPTATTVTVTTTTAVVGAVDGRLVPVVSAKFISAVEAVNPHLAESTVADELWWRYCVEFKFRRGGPTRPIALHVPWPQLVQHVQQMGEQLLLLLCGGGETSDDDNEASLVVVINQLSHLPMNVALLRDSGIGKLVKRVLKKRMQQQQQQQERLRQLLATWMQVAEESVQKAAKAAAAASTARGSNDDNDLTLAESCRTWRDLYVTLTDRNDQVRHSQGQRMREIRKNLAQSRPKLVKVRPATEKQRAILAGMGTTSLSPAAKLAAAHAQRGKLLLVQNEARMMALRQQRIAPKRKAAFGDAVAFASGTKKGAAHKRQKVGGTLHRVDGEGGPRLLKIPDSRRPLRTTTPSAAAKRK